MSVEEKEQIKLPYLHTTLLINELVNLQYEESGGNKIRVFEKPGMRKDRYSSLSYNFYVATQLESKLGRRVIHDYNVEDIFICRPPMYKKVRL